MGVFRLEFFLPKISTCSTAYDSVRTSVWHFKAGGSQSGFGLGAFDEPEPIILI